MSEKVSNAVVQVVKTPVDAINVIGNNGMNYEHLKGTGDAITEDILGLSMPQELTIFVNSIYFNFQILTLSCLSLLQVRTTVCQNWPYE